VGVCALARSRAFDSLQMRTAKEKSRPWAGQGRLAFPLVPFEFVEVICIRPNLYLLRSERTVKPERPNDRGGPAIRIALIVTPFISATTKPGLKNGVAARVNVPAATAGGPGTVKLLLDFMRREVSTARAARKAAPRPRLQSAPTSRRPPKKSNSGNAHRHRHIDVRTGQVQHVRIGSGGPTR
jgi:hypothetical protein